jgi:hypothetical protein
MSKLFLPAISVWLMLMFMFLCFGGIAQNKKLTFERITAETGFDQ